MKLSSLAGEGQVRFVISDFDRKYEKVLEMCFYKKEKGVYFKDFPRSYPHIESIKENFEKNGKKMFDQLGYFTEIPWEKALYDFCTIMRKNIDWWLTGSCAACLRGIELNPHDVDVMVDARDVEKIAEAFSKDLIEPIVHTNGWVTKDFGVIFLHARIDIASDPVEELDHPLPIDCGPTARSNLESIPWKGFEIKIPPIQYQWNVNKLRGREERVKKIESYMSK